MHVSAVLVLFLALVSANDVTQFEKLGDEDIETAPYKVVKLPEPRDYEKRIYPTLHWVTTKFKWSESIGFLKLYQYIQGQNSEAIKINMTTPVVVTWEKTDMVLMPFMRDEISFYIPQKNPPLPTNPDLFLEYTPMTLYSWAYKGFSTDLDFTKARLRLEYELSKDNILYNTSVVFYATYNKPFESDGKNEVWILAVEK